ncbi:hypothetical protein J6590_105206, partial [Homalodisca vitripennis]
MFCKRSQVIDAQFRGKEFDAPLLRYCVQGYRSSETTGAMPHYYDTACRVPQFRNNEWNAPLLRYCVQGTAVQRQRAQCPTITILRAGYRSSETTSEMTHYYDTA